MSTKLASAIEHVSIDTIKPYKKNARLHSPDQIDKIVASMVEFGFVNPVLVDASHTIVAGHGRFEAAKKLKLATVPVIVLDHLTQAQARALVLADNRIAEDARWDYDLIGEELAALKASEFDLDTIGFTETELENLLPDLEAEADKILAAHEPKKERVNHSSHVPDDDDDESEEDEEVTITTPKAETVEIDREVIGSREFKPDQFEKFDHKCPRCSFEFNS